MHDNRDDQMGHQVGNRPDERVEDPVAGVVRRAPELSVSTIGPVCVIRVRCPLDTRTAPTLTQLLDQEFVVGHPAVVVDLTRCAQVSQAGAAALRDGQRRAPTTTMFAVAGAQPAVARTLRLCGLTPPLPTYPSVDHAVAALSRHG